MKNLFQYLSKKVEIFTKGLIELLNSSLLPYHELLNSFKNGGGINYDKIDQGFWNGIDQTGCTRYRHF